MLFLLTFTTCTKQQNRSGAKHSSVSGKCPDMAYLTNSALTNGPDKSPQSLTQAFQLLSSDVPQNTRSSSPVFAVSFPDFCLIQTKRREQSGNEASVLDSFYNTVTDYKDHTTLTMMLTVAQQQQKLYFCKMTSEPCVYNFRAWFVFSLSLLPTFKVNCVLVYL